MSKTFVFDNELGEVRLDQASQTITLRGGPNDTNAKGGDIAITAADGSGTGGGSQVQITTGAAGSTSTLDGGKLTITAGDGGGTSGDGGEVEINSGNSLATGAGGAIGITSGNAGPTSVLAGGKITITAGNGGGSGTFATGGAVEINSGDAVSGGVGPGGVIDINAGAGRGATKLGGAVEINAGQSFDFNGGPVKLKGGTSRAAGTFGGNVEINGGDGGGFGPEAHGGSVILEGGEGYDDGGGTPGDGGDVVLQSGITNGDGDAGDIDFILSTADDPTAYAHGEINIYENQTAATPDWAPRFLMWDGEKGSSTYRTAIGSSPDLAQDVDFVIPPIQGDGGQFLTTDGQGNLGWGNPATVTATGGGKIQTDGTYAPEGGAGLGIGQTWTGSNLFGATRAANTNYTNNSSCPIAVAITFSTGDDTNSAILVNGVEVAKWDVEGIGSPYLRTLYAVVPAGQSYMGFVRASTIVRWTEMTTTGSCGNPGGLGVNQIWGGQSRSLNTAYTNNTGYPIALSIKLGVANAATATLRVSNSGAPGAGDEVDQFNATTIGSGAGDNFVTLFGVVPNGGQYDVTTSGSVINIGWFELRGPTPVNGGGLGVGQTWTANLNPGTRVANTAYENTDSCPRHIQVRTSGIGSTVVETGASAGTLTEVSRQDPGGVTVDNTAVVFTVPAGRFYQVTTSNTITSWKELDGGTCSAAALTKIIDADQDTFVRVAETATGDQDSIDMRVGDNSGDYDVSGNIMELSTAGVTIDVPDANGNSGTANGGSVTIEAGDGDSGGTGGAIFLQPGYGGSGPPAIPTGTGIPEPTELWFVDGQGTPQYVGFKAPDDISAASTGDGANTIWTLPEGDGGANEVIITDGSGVLSWIDAPSLVPPAGADTQVQFNDSGAFGADADFTWDSSTNKMTVGSSGSPATITSPAGADLQIETDDTNGLPGEIIVKAGDADAGSGTNASGGKITIESGVGSGTGAGGLIDIKSGVGGSNDGDGGNIDLTAADGRPNADGSGGSLNFKAGRGNTNGGFGNGGAISIEAGNGGSASGSGGAISIKSGSVGGSVSSDIGGDITIQAGASIGNAGGGILLWTGGVFGGSNSGGDIDLLVETSGDGSPPHGSIRILPLGGLGQGDGETELRFYEDSGNQYYTAIKASGAMPGSYTMTLPVDEGTSGYVLTTDGNDPATLSWTMVGSGTLSFPLLANPNGSAGAPAYSFNGKATVGMYSDAANTIGFSTDGDPRVVITNTDTTLKREGGVEHQLLFEDGTDGTYVGLQAPNNVTTQVVWALPVADGATDGEVMATDSSGQLKFNKMAYVYSSAGSAATGHTITHNLNQQYVTYTIYDRATGQKIVNAATEIATDANTLTLTFTVAQDIIVSIMAVPGLGVNT